MNTIHILTLQQDQAAAGGGYQSIGLLVLLFVVFWFFMIRPQMKRQKELRKYRESLQKGDKILTTGGIFGKIIEISGHAVIIEVENQGRLKVLKEAIVKDLTDAPATTR
jgi:preprotein translocase subunit YajC